MAQSERYISCAWWLVLFPGAAIFLTVTAFNLVGEGLRDAMQSVLESPERARTGVRITAAVVSQRCGAEPRLDRVHAVYRETGPS